MMDPTAAPVVVVGAGPVGASAAIQLAQRGISVVVIDRWTDVYPQPRAVHLDDEVYRILARMGVADAFAAVSRPAMGLRLVDRDLTVLGEFDRAGLSPVSGYHRATMYDQPDLERILRDRMAALENITFRGGVEVTGVEIVTARSARVLLRDIASDRPDVIDASYVLGCDGANSMVRDVIGTAMEDLRFDQRWLVIDIDTAVDLRQWDGVHQVCDGQRAATYMRIGETRYRWEFQLQDDETADDFVTIDALLPLLRPWIGAVSDPADLVLMRCTSYTFRAALAERWRRDGVFILGDAAHLTPPFIGQGLGAGIRDAANLTWKVAGVLTGELDPAVLDSYAVERRAHARQLIDLALRLGVAMTRGGRAGDLVRSVAVPAMTLIPEVRRQISDSATPPLTASALVADAGPLRRRDRLAGSLVPHGEGGLGGDPRDRRLDAHLGGRWAIVTAHPIAPSDRTRLARLDVVIVEAPTGPLGDWLAAGKARAAVVRPDAAVLGSFATAPTAVAALLTVVRPSASTTARSLTPPVLA